MNRRVVITGVGMISAAGNGYAESVPRFVAGECALSPLNEDRPPGLRARYGGVITQFDEDQLRAESPWLRDCDRFVLLAVEAARETLQSARIHPRDLGRRLGLVFSTCSGPMLLIEDHYERLIRGDNTLSREELFAKRYYSGAKVLSQLLEVQGFATTVVTACSASTSAVALGTDLIRCGMLDAVLAGGSDSLSMSTLAGFDGLKVTCEDRCAPFSRPVGLNLGEAAGFVYLETLDAAHTRNARVRAEVLGSGMSNDAFHCSSPDPAGRGLALAITRALTDANLTTGDIAYINAHGTGTEANDRAETRAMRRILGERTPAVPVSSTKSIVGHCLGAAGIVETLATLACAEAGVLPPTANFTEPREDNELDFVPKPGRPWTGGPVFLSNNLAFGGHNASIVIRHGDAVTEGQRPPAPAEPVYITGCGLVCALGLGRTALTDNAAPSQPPTQPARHPALAGLRVGSVDDTKVMEYDRRLDLRQMDPSSRWATVATRMAMREAGYPERRAQLSELGLFLNLSAGPSWAEVEYLTSFLTNNRQVKELMPFPYIVPSSVAGNVCRALHLCGHNLTLNGGPGAGLLGLAPALAALKTGHANSLLCGAVDELSDRILIDHHQAGWIGTLPPGEGSVVLMLETAGTANSRGAKPFAEMCGVVCGSDPQPGPDGAPEPAAIAAFIRRALTELRVEAANVGAVCVAPHSPQMKQALEEVHPAWPERHFSFADRSGHLEGAQTLLDVAGALQLPDPADPQLPYLVALTTSSWGVSGLAVFKRVDPSTQSQQHSALQPRF